MANFRISDFVNTDTLTDLDIFEVSTHANGEFTSQNINILDLATEVAKRIGAGTEGQAVIPSRWGIGGWSFKVSSGIIGHEVLNFPQQTSTFKYQTLTVRLNEFGTVPDNATHVSLRGLMRISRDTDITSGVSFACSCHALDPSDSVSTFVSDLNTKYSTNSDAVKHAMRGKLDGKFIVNDGFGIDAKQDETAFQVGTTYVEINRTGSFPTATVVVAINRYSTGVANPFGTAAQRQPSTQDLNNISLNLQVQGFLV